MGTSEDTDQQRRREIGALKRFVGCSLAGSLLLHGILLSLKIVDPQNAAQPRPTEVTIVPRKPPSVEAKPVQQMPLQLPEQLPDELQPVQPDEPTSLPEVQVPDLASSETPSPLAPEGDPNAVVDESAQVGSGLAPGAGGFSEGIGLNRSNSPIRGSGGGARRGVPEGAPGGTGSPPAVTAPPAPQPEPVPPAPDPARQAVCRRCPSPDYPRAALQASVEGRVQVAVDVDAQGRVVGVRLSGSSGDRTIDNTVLETVRDRWRFETISGGANNVPVEVYMTVEGSDLNRRAQDWGDRTAVEVPTAGFAAPAPEPTATQSDRLPSSVEPLPELPVEIPEPAPELLVETPEPASEPLSQPLAQPLEMPEPEPLTELSPAILPTIETD
jgi:TonB family protein